MDAVTCKACKKQQDDYDDLIDGMCHPCAAAIVARLPRTADGVPIVPGMDLYRITDGGMLVQGVSEWRADTPFFAEYMGNPHTPENPRECYSTRDAAMFAMKSSANK